MPSQLVLTRDALMKDVVTSDVLQQHLGLSYLHSGVAASLSPSLRQALDIHTLHADHLIQVGKIILTDTDGKSEEGEDARYQSFSV